MCQRHRRRHRLSPARNVNNLKQILDVAGSRRPSLASLHSSTSSAKSYSARRLERERNEKEQRLALVELKLKREQQQQQRELREREQRDQPPQQPVAPTPSPRTPHSTDELLPSVEEATEIYYNEVRAQLAILRRMKFFIVRPRRIFEIYFSLYIDLVARNEIQCLLDLPGTCGKCRGTDISAGAAREQDNTIFL